MAKMKVFTLDNLTLYDSLIKGYVDAADAKSLKTVAIEGSVLKFYRVSEPVGDTEPAYTIELPETDVSGLLAKLTGATAGHVVTAKADGTIADGGVALADLAKADALKTVSDKVDAIEHAETGILASAKKYTDEEVKELANGAVKTNTDAIVKLNGDASTDGSVAKAVKDSANSINAKIGTVAEGKTVVGMIEDVVANAYDDEEVRGLIKDNADAIDALEGNVGDIATLKTTDKTSVVAAVNEVKDAVDTNATNAKVTVSTDTTTEGYLKSYTIKQGETELAVIDIPKDLVVSAGEVVENPDGMAPGTYVKLTIANQEEPIYINVKDLVDAYTAAQEATQVQLEISPTNEISATIVDGSIDTKALADKAVTLAKLADEVKSSFDASGAASTAETNAKKYTDDEIAKLDADVTSAAVTAGKGIQVQVVETDGKISSVAVTGNYDESYDAKGAAATALADAKTYADGLDTAMDTRVDALETKVGEGFEAITTTEINALFGK